MTVGQGGHATRSLRRRHSLRALLLAATLVVAACGGNDDEPDRPDPPEPVDNTAPSAEAGDDQTVAPGAAVTLDGSQSRDAEDDTLSYSWRQGGEGTPVTLSGADTATATFTAPGVTETTELAFSLTVTDTGDLATADTVTITINPPPAAQAGDDQIVAPGATVTLDGSQSSDPGDGELEYAWTLPAGTDITLSDAEAAAPTFIAPAVTEDTEYILTLTVTDEDDTEATDTVTINVNIPPVADAGDDETASPGDRVILDGTDSRDPEGGDLEYSWALTTGTGITLFGDDEAKPTFTAPAATTDTTYTFTLTVTAENGAVATDTVNITVRATRMVAAGDSVTISGPANANATGYAWRQVGGPDVALDDPTATEPTFTAPTVTTDTILTFERTVTAADGTTETTTVAVVVAGPGTTISPSDPNPTNQAPVANAGRDIPAAAGELIILSGSGSTNADGSKDNLRYAWTPVSGVGFTLSGADTVIPSFTAPATTTEARLVFTLTVTDANGASATDEVTITVAAGIPPTANAGPDQDAVTGGTTVTLDGSGSTAPAGGSIAEYSWTLTSGSGITLSGDTTAKPTFATTVPATDTTYEFALTVTADNGLASPTPDTMSVTVLANQAPTANAGDDGTVAAGGTATLDGSGSTDPEGGTLSHAWEQTSGPGVTLSSTSAAAPTFTAPTGILDVTLTFELTVTDPRGLTTKDTASIAVTGDVDMHEADDHDGPVHGIALSTDGSLAVSGGMDGTVRLWNAPSGAEITFDAGGGVRSLGRHDDPVYAVAISGDGKRAISGGYDGVLKLWNTDADDAAGYGTEVTYGSGADTRGLGEAGIWIYAVALNADGTRAVSGGLDGAVRLWNTAATGTRAGTEVKRFGSETADRYLGRHFHTESDGGTPNDPSDDVTRPVSVYAVDISDDGGRVLSGGADGVVRVWNTASGAEVYALTDDDAMGPVFGVDMSRDGNLAVSGSADNHIHVWNITGTNTGTERVESDPNSIYSRQDVTSVAFSGDDTTLTTGLANGTVLRWDDIDGTPPLVAPDSASFTHSDYVWSVAASGDGGIRASASNDGLVLFWDTDAPPHRHTNAGTSTILEITPSGNDANWDGDDVTMHELTDHSGNVRAVDLSADGSRLASGADGGNRLLLWDVDASTVRATPGLADMQHGNRIWSAALSADGRILASASRDNTMRLWDTATGEQLNAGSDNAHDDEEVFGVTLSPDGGTALSGGKNDDVLLWDVATGTAKPDGTVVAGDVWGVTLSADGLLAVTGGIDSQLTVWTRGASTETFAPRSRNTNLQDDTSGAYQITDITGLGLSADGSIAVSGSKDTAVKDRDTPFVRVWNVTGGSPGLARRMERHHTDEVLGVDLSADGRLAISGSRDDTARLWDVATGKLLRTMTGHTNDVSSVAMNADGRLAASGSFDGKVRVYRIGRGHAMAPPKATAMASTSHDTLPRNSTSTTVTLDGSGSQGAVAYHWRQTDGPIQTLSGAGTAGPTFIILGPIVPQILAFELAVTDQRGLLATNMVSITQEGSLSTTGRDEDTPVRGIAVSRDGHRAVSGGHDGNVCLWDAYSTVEIRFDDGARCLGSHGADSEVYAVAISADGSRALSGGSDGTVRLWDTVAGTEVTYGSDNDSLGAAGVWVYAVAISADGGTAVSGGFDGKVRLYDTATGNEKVRFNSDTSDRSLGDHGQHSVYAVAISADGGRVLSGGSDGKVYLRDADSGAEYELTDDDGPMGQVFGVDLSADGNLAVSGGADNHIHVWNVADTGAIAEVREIDPGVDFDVTSVALSTDKTRLASGHGNSEVRLWNLDTGALIRTFITHWDYVWSVALRDNAYVLLSASSDERIRWWDPTQDTLRLRDAALTQDGNLAPTDIGDVKPIAFQSTNGHGISNIEGVAINADGTRAATAGGTDGKVIFWNVPGRSALRTMMRPNSQTSHISGVHSVALSADGGLAVSGGYHSGVGHNSNPYGYLRVWDTSDGSQEDSERTTTSGEVSAVAITADGNRVMSAPRQGINNGEIRIWDTSTPTTISEKRYTITGGDSHLGNGNSRTDKDRTDVHGVALSRDGSIGMSGARRRGSSDQNLRFWDVNATTQANTLMHHASFNHYVYGVALSDNGEVGVSGHYVSNNSIRIWDRNNRTVTQRSLPSMNQGGFVFDVAITGDGRVVLSGGDNGTLKLWDAVSGTELRNLKIGNIHGNDDVNSVSMASHGRIAITGGDRGKFYRWDIGRSRLPSTPSSSGSAPPSLTGAAPRSLSAAASAVPPTCAAFVNGDGLVRGQAHGGNCVYPASLLGADNPIETDLTIPALPNGGTHVFEQSLVVGSAAASDSKSPSAPRAGHGDAPTLTIEAGAVLAFGGASSSLIVNPGGRLLAVGTAAEPITLTSPRDAAGWGGIQIHGGGKNSGQLEFIVVKHAGAMDATSRGDAGAAIELRNVGADTVVRNLQTYASHGDGLALTGGTVNVENFVSVYARGNSIDIGADWSGSLRHALVIAPEHGGDHCLHADGATHDQAQGTISGLTCITSPPADTDASRGLGAGIHLGTGAAPVIERSMVVGTFADDADVRLNYCLHIDGDSPQAAMSTLPGPIKAEPTKAGPALIGNIFACKDKTGDAMLAATITRGNNQFADVEAPTDPTAATDTQLQLLGGTPPVYSLDYDELRINGADTTVTPPEGADFPGAASESAAPNWLRPNGIDWTHGIFEGSRDKPLWFEPER